MYTDATTRNSPESDIDREPPSSRIGHGVVPLALEEAPGVFIFVGLKRSLSSNACGIG